MFAHLCVASPAVQAVSHSLGLPPARRTGATKQPNAHTHVDINTFTHTHARALPSPALMCHPPQHPPQVASMVAQSLDLPPSAARWRHNQRAMTSEPQRATRCVCVCVRVMCVRVWVWVCVRVRVAPPQPARDDQPPAAGHLVCGCGCVLCVCVCVCGCGCVLCVCVCVCVWRHNQREKTSPFSAALRPHPIGPALRCLSC